MNNQDQAEFLTVRQLTALRSATAHVDRMALTGVKTARTLVKRGLAESYGSGRIVVTERGEAVVAEWAAHREMERECERLKMLLRGKEALGLCVEPGCDLPKRENGPVDDSNRYCGRHGGRFVNGPDVDLVTEMRACVARRDKIRGELRKVRENLAEKHAEFKDLMTEMMTGKKPDARS